MNLRKLAALSTLLFVAGCDPTGTCIRIADKESPATPSTCEVNVRKSSCAEGADKGEFTKENEIAGMIDCKMAGFWEDNPNDTSSKSGERISYHRSGDPDAPSKKSGGAKPADPIAVGLPKYVSAAGNYEVQFEHTPVTSVVADPQGVPWQQAEDKDSGAFMVQYADFSSPAEAAAQMQVFQLTRDPTQMKVDKAITIQGFPGREMELSMHEGKMTLWLRFIQVGSRLYKIGGGYKLNRTKVADFVESLKITGNSGASASGAILAAPDAQPAPEPVAVADTPAPAQAPVQAQAPAQAPARAPEPFQPHNVPEEAPPPPAATPAPTTPPVRHKKHRDTSSDPFSKAK